MGVRQILLTLAVAVGCVWSVLGAEPGITVAAKQRYPWNGLVDLKFTITGTSGTKYDTSFVAKDMVGGTNITMKTIRKSNGVAAAEKEQLLPGNYSWVWDAAADLPKDFVCDRVKVVGTAETVHEKVQLWEGGPYWAKKNIGADEPHEYGYYFWYGDSVGYKRENGAWVATDGSSTDFSFYPSDIPIGYFRWSDLVNKGWVTSDYILKPNHDAAYIQWGQSWRLPTGAELRDLINKCEWEWTTMNNVNGYVVRGKGDYSSASIFLPIGGHGYGSWLQDTNWGRYWSSEFSTNSNQPYHLYFRKEEGPYFYYKSVYYGMPIRPVYENK